MLLGTLLGFVYRFGSLGVWIDCCLLGCLWVLVFVGSIDLGWLWFPVFKCILYLAFRLCEFELLLLIIICGFGFGVYWCFFDSAGYFGGFPRFV